MGEEWMGAIISTASFFFVYALVKLTSDNKIRHKLIDKGMVDENVKFLYTQQADMRVPNALKWGLVLIGIGAAVLIGQMVPSRMSGEVTVGSIFLMAGLGLMLYYFIAKRIMGE